ncbi:uncharacterized protein [Prorops nasuta]|uniref:uncharacterized protein n=1 Tax=Prorops nasuta TaxID=863751 RepID=UPI0034D00DF6
MALRRGWQNMGDGCGWDEARCTLAGQYGVQLQRGESGGGSGSRGGSITASVLSSPRSAQSVSRVPRSKFAISPNFTSPTLHTGKKAPVLPSNPQRSSEYRKVPGIGV